MVETYLLERKGTFQEFRSKVPKDGLGFVHSGDAVESTEGSLQQVSLRESRIPDHPDPGL